MNGIIFILDLFFCIGVLSLISYFMRWLIKEREVESEFGSLILKLLLWLGIVIIVKNVLFYSFTSAGSPIHSPLRPFLSLILLIVDTSTIFLILFLGFKLNIRETLINGTILIVIRRLIELGFYYLVLIIFNSNVEGGFYIFIPL